MPLLEMLHPGYVRPVNGLTFSDFVRNRSFQDSQTLSFEPTVLESLNLEVYKC
jgi:hypothetical protein